MLVAALSLAACERGRVVLSYPDAPPDFAGTVIAVDPPRGLLVLRDSAGTDHRLLVPEDAAVARRVANLVTSAMADSIEPGATLEVWLAGRRDGAVPEAAVLPRAFRLIIVDLADALGASREPTRAAGRTAPAAGAGPLP